MWHSYVASCHHSRVEGLLWPLVLDGGYEVWQTGDVLGDQFSLVGSTLGEVISRDRFTQINKFLHFSDDSGLRNADKPHKVRYVLDECRRSFQAEYAPNREVAIDEAMVPFKGRLGMKQYMRDQPVSVSAYCHNFDVDVGKSNTCCDCHVWLSIKGGYRPLLKKGHLIYTDNFYTSPQLADYLYTQDTYLCGTIRTNRNGYPKQLVPSSAVARRMPRGSSDCSRLVHYSNWHPTGRTMESCSICRHSIIRKVTSWLRQGAVRMVRCCSLTRHPRSKPMPQVHGRCRSPWPEHQGEPVSQVTVMVPQGGDEAAGVCIVQCLCDREHTGWAQSSEATEARPGVIPARRGAWSDWQDCRHFPSLQASQEWLPRWGLDEMGHWPTTAGE